MKLCVVSIRDSALGAYMRPFVVPTPAMAVRGFTDEVSREGSEMGKHREDYELFQVAVFDEDTGKFDNLDSPRSLVRGSDIGDSRE